MFRFHLRHQSEWIRNIFSMWIDPITNLCKPNFQSDWIRGPNDSDWKLGKDWFEFIRIEAEWIGLIFGRFCITRYNTFLRNGSEIDINNNNFLTQCMNKWNFSHNKFYAFRGITCVIPDFWPIFQEFVSLRQKKIFQPFFFLSMIYLCCFYTIFYFAVNNFEHGVIVRCFNLGEKW